MTHKRDKSPANAKPSWDYASFPLGFANSCQPSSSKMTRELSSIVKKLTTRQSKREEKNVAMSDLDSTKKENWKKVQADRALKRLLKHLTSSIRQLDYTFTFLRTVNPWLIVKCCMSKSFQHSTSVSRDLELVFTLKSLNLLPKLFIAPWAGCRTAPESCFTAQAGIAGNSMSSPSSSRFQLSSCRFMLNIVSHE